MVVCISDLLQAEKKNFLMSIQIKNLKKKSQRHCSARKASYRIAHKILFVCVRACGRGVQDGPRSEVASWRDNKPEAYSFSSLLPYV
jgi:hypothetical protein